MENSEFNAAQEEINIKELLLKYAMYWRWFVIGVICTLTIAFFYLRYTKQIYQTTAKIKILDNSQGGMKLPSDLSSLFSNKKVNLDNEIEVLKSHRIIERVVLDLNLTTAYYSEGNIVSAELWKDAPFKVIWLDVKDSVNSKKLEFKIKLQSGGYTISSANESPSEVVAFGQKNKLEGQSFILIGVPEYQNKKGNTGNFTIIRRPLHQVVQHISNAIGVASTAKQSEILTISLKGENKGKSEDIIDALIDQFNQDGVNDRQLISQRTIDFVNDRFVYLSSELDSIENTKEVYKKQNKLSYLPEDAKVTIEKKTLSESQFFNYETQIALAKLLEETLSKEGAFELLPANIGIENENVNQLIAEYNKSKLDRDKLLLSAGTKNPMVLEFSDKLMELRKNILFSVKVLQKQLALAINNIKSLKQENNSVFGSIPAKEKILRSIERQQTIKETLYLFLLQRREEASVAKAITTPSIKVVDYAITDFIPVAPKKNIIYLAALLMGLLIPFGIIYLRMLLDTKIHNKLDFDRLAPSIPVVAEIPYIDEEHRIISSNDRSVLAEAFRILRTNINYLLPIKSEGECPVIYTGSSIKGEGKTFVSLNLALTLASLDKKVLLIGADLRNPQLHKYLKIKKDRIGLSNYLYDINTHWEKLINTKNFNNDYLDIIFAGSVPPNPAELLSNGRFEELLGLLKKEYDYIVVDTAPTILVTDTLLISQLADLTVYITRADHTDKKLLTYSKGLKEQGKLKNMAYVINNVGGSKGGYGYGYGYSYGYGYGYNYGYGYGYGDEDEANALSSKKSKWTSWFKK